MLDNDSAFDHCVYPCCVDTREWCGGWCRCTAAMAQATASAKPAGLPAPAANAKPQRRPVAHDMTPGCWDKFSMGFMTPVVVAGAHDRLEMEDLRPLRTSGRCIAVHGPVRHC